METILAKIQEEYKVFVSDAEKAAAGNKSAGVRARKASMELEKHFKEFRKASMELEKHFKEFRKASLAKPE